MASDFWQKRPSKKMVATVLLVIVLLTVWFFRREIAIKSIERFTKEQNLQISRLDFSLNWRLNLKIAHAYITSPLGTVSLRHANWQPWSNVLSIEQVTVNHLKQQDTDNKVADAQQSDSLSLPGSLPKLIISNLDIDSYLLLEPLHLSVDTDPSSQINISGDVDAAVKLHSNTVIGQIKWRLSDLTKWIPQAQNLAKDNATLIAQLVATETPIQTDFTFNGSSLSAESNLDLASDFKLSNCAVGLDMKGKVVFDVNFSSLNIGVDVSNLSNQLSLVNCVLIQDYFATDDLPQLAFIIPKKITLDANQINLPTLQITDSHNAQRRITLTDLHYKTTGELSVNYKITVKQPIETKQIQVKSLDFLGEGRLLADFSSRHTQQPLSLNIQDSSNRLIANGVKTDALFVTSLTSDFYFLGSRPNQLALQGTINSANLKMGETHLTKTNSSFALTVENLTDIQLLMDNHIEDLKHPDAKVKKITNVIDLTIKQGEALSFKGQSKVTNLAVENIIFMPIAVVHTGQANLPNKTVSSQHDIALENEFAVELTQQQRKVKLHIRQQPIKGLAKLAFQLEDELSIQQGKLFANIELVLPLDDNPFSARGNVELQEGFVKYQNTLLNNIAYQTPLTFNSAGLQLTASKLQIDSIDVGVMLNQLEAEVLAMNSKLRLQDIQGGIFNGKFFVDNLWLDGRNQQVEVDFQNIDLAQVVALQKQPGIQVTGNLAGKLPVFIDNKGISIKDGWASSLAGGKLTIVDNPSFDSIKQQQPELALLENLNFSQLKSKVKFNPDGWMIFDFAITGNNPDKQQSVNFNYSHEENILTLLESIRLVKSVENKIEKKLTQGDEK